ncbi:hypothetical protein PACILC2_53360 [Paenibacillus cisolokensis]|jgi:Transcriptional regulators containing a DNA-binding HTH domain and an aminotransferase domain (MocR family) and their eukaryotic orthologs|uniref:Uncharacterized protein n=1 Tax=Paenibacillus cisolokensis TaxID=1658519 RepID=A0ABQ4NFM0_9BACL|nr:hypothetical protein PACILC2_53360 [Paenibacillus cisolokensis]
MAPFIFGNLAFYTIIRTQLTSLTVPRKEWAKYLKIAAGDSPGILLDYEDIRGEEQLRSEISVYLHRTRGMRCSIGQIMIVSGSSEGFALIAKAML